MLNGVVVTSAVWQLQAWAKVAPYSTVSVRGGGGLLEMPDLLAFKPKSVPITLKCYFTRRRLDARQFDEFAMVDCLQSTWPPFAAQNQPAHVSTS